MQTTTKIVSSIFIFLFIAGAATYAAPQLSIGLNHTASTLAIPGQGGGNGGGGGSGGGGVTSDEPYGNIAKADRMEKSLIANQPVSYTFTAPELSIYQIDVTGKENENDVMVRVELLNQRSQKILSSPPGAVYKYVNIFLSTKRITGAIIKFKVANIDSVQSLDLLRWDGTGWNSLDAVETGKDSAFTYYSANTEGFSSFAIVGRPLIPVTPAITTKPEPIGTGPAPSQPPAAETPEPVPHPKKMPWLAILIGGIVIAGVIAYVLWRRR